MRAMAINGMAAALSALSTVYTNLDILP